MPSGQDYGLSQIAQKRLRRELLQLKAEKDFKIEAKPYTDRDGQEDLSRWHLTLDGCPDSLYEGYRLKAKIAFPSKYPNLPPTFVFETKIWHPNVYEDGRVCISILHTANDNLLDASIEDCSWTAVQSVRTICISIMSMLNDPNICSPANVDASKQYRDDKEGYKKKVKELLEKHADKKEM
ncbi:hypothetical protein NUSPORA_02897 [Nucleospora cyclopteri]